MFNWKRIEQFLFYIIQLLCLYNQVFTHPLVLFLHLPQKNKAGHVKCLPPVQHWPSSTWFLMTSRQLYNHFCSFSRLSIVSSDVDRAGSSFIFAVCNQTRVFKQVTAKFISWYRPEHCVHPTGKNDKPLKICPIAGTKCNTANQKYSVTSIKPSTSFILPQATKPVMVTWL